MTGKLHFNMVWIAVAAFFAISLLWLVTGRQNETEVFGEYSTYNTGAEGISLAYNYLKIRTERDNAFAGVNIATKPLSIMQVENDAVILRICPEYSYFSGFDDSRDSLFGEAEKKWMEAGGRLIIALDENSRTAQIHRDAGTENGNIDLKVFHVNQESDYKKVFPAWPSVNDIINLSGNVLTGAMLKDTYSIITLQDYPVICRKKFGNGDLYLISCPEVFRNEHIADADHLALLEALIGSRRPVYFDEYIHGVQTELTILNLLMQWHLGPLTALTAFLLFALFWRKRSIPGIPVDDYAETRTEAVDLVDSIARLYDRALSRSETLELFYKNLTHTVSLKTGLRKDSLEKRLNELTDNLPAPKHVRKRDISRQEFQHILKIINNAFRRLENVKTK